VIATANEVFVENVESAEEVAQQVQDFDTTSVDNLKAVDVAPTQYEYPVFFGVTLEASEAETVMYTLFGVGLALLLALLATIVLLCNEKSKKSKWEDNDSYDMKENGVENASFKKDVSKF